ncbi:TonB family protein [Stenotrophomonas sp. 24(2023)]|uniref:energy transducer TonB n=1 Tax=Stenotrophomonas sp. 24(2023) TaxID=3068324 RepID=UPI0027E09B3C|nr:TonB family protein [Stenotrophomonas sp. 24(2023)]WMJ69378.1 TonB family protein [Stenotrophomonas sp. 24(2023)]
MSAAPSRHWAIAALLATLLHAAVIAMLLWPTHDRVPLPATAAVRMVMLVPAETVQAPPAADTPLPVGPPVPQGRPAEAEAAVLPAPVSVRSTVPATAVPPVPAAADGELAVAAGAAPASAAPGAEQATAPPASAAAPGPQVQAPRDSSGSGLQAMARWQAQLLGHLERHKRYPRQAQRRREQGVADVQFAVDRHGQVSAIRLLQGSGVAALDAETLAVVQRAQPVPPPPAGVPGDPVQVVVPVEFFLDRR